MEVPSRRGIVLRHGSVEGEWCDARCCVAGDYGPWCADPPHPDDDVVPRRTTRDHPPDECVPPTTVVIPVLARRDGSVRNRASQW